MTTGNSERGIVLQERDRRLLRDLGVMRVIDREQAKFVAGFGSTTRANARLLGLTRAGLLRRFFMGTDAVGIKALYTLSPKGAKLVEASYRGLQRRQDEVVVADFFVSHQLAVNEIYCILKYRAIPIPHATFVRWLSFSRPLEASLNLIPDGFVELETRNALLGAFFEIDLGSETRSVWQAKVTKYIRYADSGNFAEQFGRPRFRVLVVTESERRTASLRVATAELTDEMFWFTSFDAVRRQGFWSAIWQRPKDDCVKALFSLS